MARTIFPSQGMEIFAPWGRPAEVVPASPSGAVSRQRMPHGIELSSQPLPWIQEAIRAVLNFESLPANWNSYGARPIQRSLIFSAILVLRQLAQPKTPKPALIPTTEGGVQIEWHQGGIDLEIKIISPQRCSMSFEDSRAGLAWEDEFDLNDLGRARSAVESLSERA